MPREPHLWRVPMRQQARCWCEPFVSTDHGAIVDADGIVGIAYHRPYAGYLFREYGEQGPLTAKQQRMLDAAAVVMTAVARAKRKPRCVIAEVR